MPITAQSIIDKVRQALDAEEAPTSPQLGYYDDLKDIIPNINNAIDWLVGTSVSYLEEKKFQSELLRELIQTKIWQASINSRIALTTQLARGSAGVEIWTILNVYPKPTVAPRNPVTVSPTPPNSVFRPDVSFISGDRTAKRLTFQEWNKNRGNPFQSGNLIFQENNAPDLVDYAYLNASDYTSTNYVLSGTAPVIWEIEIRPSVASQLVGVTFVAIPSKITANGQSIQFPEMASNLLYEKTLRLISIKQGDKTNLATLTDEELTQQLKAII